MNGRWDAAEEIELWKLSLTTSCADSIEAIFRIDSYSPFVVLTKTFYHIVRMTNGSKVKKSQAVNPGDTKNVSSKGFYYPTTYVFATELIIKI